MATDGEGNQDMKLSEGRGNLQGLTTYQAIVENHSPLWPKQNLNSGTRVRELDIYRLLIPTTMQLCIYVQSKQSWLSTRPEHGQDTLLWDVLPPKERPSMRWKWSGRKMRLTRVLFPWTFRLNVPVVYWFVGSSPIGRDPTLLITAGSLYRSLYTCESMDQIGTFHSVQFDTITFKFLIWPDSVKASTVDLYCIYLFFLFGNCTLCLILQLGTGAWIPSEGLSLPSGVGTDWG